MKFIECEGFMTEFYRNPGSMSYAGFKYSVSLYKQSSGDEGIHISNFPQHISDKSAEEIKITKKKEVERVSKLIDALEVKHAEKKGLSMNRDFKTDLDAVLEDEFKKSENKKETVALQPQGQ